MRHSYVSRQRMPVVAAVAQPVAGVDGRLALWLLAVAMIAFLALAPRLSAGDSENIRIAKALSSAYAEVVEKVSPAVVGIETAKIIRRGPSEDGRMRDYFERFFDAFPPEFGGRLPFRMGPPDQQESRRAMGIGSGVIIDAQGHILTNNHVVADADTIKVVFDVEGENPKEYKAEIVGTDPNSDLAVIRLVDPPANLVAATLGDSNALKPGNTVIAIGSPRGFRQSVSTGVVSAKGRNIGQIAYERFIQTDAAINPGNSGGPLVNLDGEVIGINAMIATESGGFQGIGFAIPISESKSIIAQLIEKGEVTRGWLGIVMNPEDPDISRALGHDGTGSLVVEVDPEGPSAKAGVRKGDLIISFDGIPIKNNDHLRYLVADTAPGRQVPLVVLRSGEKVSLTIDIATLPNDLHARARIGESGRPSDNGGPSAEAESNSIGVTVQNLSDAVRQRFSIADEVKTGVVVVKVDPEGSAAEVGVRPGTVIIELNQEPVRDIASFRAILADNADKGKVLAYVRLGEASRYVMLALK